MRVYKATYKDRSGKQRKSAKWYIDIFGHNQLQQRIQVFADKWLSETGVLYKVTTCSRPGVNSLPLSSIKKVPAAYLTLILTSSLVLNDWLFLDDSTELQLR